jgi:hypothetical protein
LPLKMATTLPAAAFNRPSPNRLMQLATRRAIDLGSFLFLTSRFLLPWGGWGWSSQVPNSGCSMQTAQTAPVNKLRPAIGVCFVCLGETSECRRHAAFATARCVLEDDLRQARAAGCPMQALQATASSCHWQLVSRDRPSAETAAFLQTPPRSFVHFGWSHRRVAFPLPAGGQPEGLAAGRVLHDATADGQLAKSFIPIPTSTVPTYPQDC